MLGENIEIMISGLPERALGSLAGDGQFERLQRLGENRAFGFAEQEVDVFRHNDVSGDDEIVSEAHRFEGLLEEIAR
jgi:hypothetical protein